MMFALRSQNINSSAMDSLIVSPDCRYTSTVTRDSTQVEALNAKSPCIHAYKARAPTLNSTLACVTSPYDIRDPRNSLAYRYIVLRSPDLQALPFCAGGHGGYVC